MTTTVSKSFTAADQVSTSLFVAEKNTTVNIAISGTYAATIRLEREVSPGSGVWQVVQSWNTANATVAFSFPTTRDNESFRLHAYAYTSGTVVTTVGTSAKTVKQLLDSSGNVLGYFTQDGFVLAGSFRRSAAPVSVGAALTLTASEHAEKTMTLDALAGSVATLPTSTGSGAKYKFLVTVLATSNSHKIQVANGTDVIQGVIVVEDTDTSNATLTFAAGSTGDTITLNRSTTGSVSIGEWIEIEDIAAGFFYCRGVITATGNPASPFSAAVS